MKIPNETVFYFDIGFYNSLIGFKKNLTEP